MPAAGVTSKQQTQSTGWPFCCKRCVVRLGNIASTSASTRSRVGLTYGPLRAKGKHMKNICGLRGSGQLSTTNLQDGVEMCCCNLGFHGLHLASMIFGRMSETSICVFPVCSHLLCRPVPRACNARQVLLYEAHAAALVQMLLHPPCLEKELLLKGNQRKLETSLKTQRYPILTGASQPVGRASI